MYDVIIVGGGPAGLTAAIYSARNKFKTLVLARDKGVLSYAHTIENYPGFKSISGLELIEKFEEQAKEFGAEVKNEEVLRISKEEDKFKVKTREQVYEAKTIILALGTEKAKLNIENEDKFIGRGISYCATCDAPFFKNKIVAVVGGSNSAAMNALALAEHAKKVYIIYRRDEIRAEKILVDRLKKAGVEIITNSIVKRVEGDNVLRRVIIEQEGKEKVLELDGLFIEIGYVPASSLAQNLNLEMENNFIKVNEKMETSIKGVFAAGDITTGSAGLRQIVTACAEGAIAAISAFRYLKAR
jgi:thioredoxin reductase (NADPH)